MLNYLIDLSLLVSPNLLSFGPNLEASRLLMKALYIKIVLNINIIDNVFEIFKDRSTYY